MHCAPHWPTGGKIGESKIDPPNLTEYDWKGERGWYIDWGESRIFVFYITDRKGKIRRKWHADRSGTRVTSWGRGKVLVGGKPKVTPGPDYENRKLTELMEETLRMARKK